MDRPKKKQFRKRVFTFALLFAPAVLLILIGSRRCEHHFIELDDYGAVREFSYTDLSGQPHTSADLKGKIVLLSILQLGCPEDCNVSLWHIDQLIYQKIRKNKNEVNEVRILSFIVDKEGKPVKDLSAIQDMMQDKVEHFDPEIWMPVSGNPEEIYNFEHKGQNLMQEGEKLLGGENYMERLLLLDKDQHLRMVRSGKLEAYVRESYGHIALLLKQYDKELARKAKK